MLVFKILVEENREEILATLTEHIQNIDQEYACEILDSLLEDDIEYAISYAYDCLLIRAFDGIYSFPYPVAMTNDANPAHAAWDIREYSVREEIPLVFTDVPREELGELIVMYRHANIDAADEDANCYTVRIMSEASLVDEIPVISVNDVVLTPINESDDPVYASLCRDEEINKFWGYDYREDVKDPEDCYFREMAEGEFARGISMTFAVRYMEKFVGEAILYAFDHIGGCECAVRLFPEYRRLGIATNAISGLALLAKDMGISYLYGSVHEENYASQWLCKKCFDEVGFHNGKRRFYQKL